MKIVAGIWANKKTVLVGEMRIFGGELLVDRFEVRVEMNTAITF